MFQSLQHRILSLFFRAGLVSATVLTACQFEPPAAMPEQKSSQGNVTVELKLRSVALAKGAAIARPTDSASITVSAPDMDAREFRFGNGTELFSLPELTPGAKRRFAVNLYRQGRLLYAGSAETTLYTDRKNSVFLHCIPKCSRVSAGVHIPLDFPRHVSKAELKLWNEVDTVTESVSQPGEFLNFHLEEVPGDHNYKLLLQLWDDTGAVSAKSVKDTLWVAMGQSVSLNLPLVTTFSQLQMTMVAEDPQQTNMSFAFPAGKRVPAAFGEMVFSEVFLSPTSIDSSSQGQWIELYNRTSDTLDISGCKIARDGGGSTSKQAILPSATLVAPGKALVVGRAAYPYANVRFSSFSFCTGLSHVDFTCKSGALKLDTITYSATVSDSLAVQTVSGKISQLRPDWVDRRTDPRGWCSVPSHPAVPSEGHPTPGILENGCPE